MATLTLTVLALALVSASLTLALTSLTPQAPPNLTANPNQLLSGEQACTISVFSVYHVGPGLIVGRVYSISDDCGQAPGGNRIAQPNQVILKIVVGRMN
jgi:hypothetical protein